MGTRRRGNPIAGLAGLISSAGARRLMRSTGAWALASLPLLSLLTLAVPPTTATLLTDPALVQFAAPGLRQRVQGIEDRIRSNTIALRALNRSRPVDPRQTRALRQLMASALRRRGLIQSLSEAMGDLKRHDRVGYQVALRRQAGRADLALAPERMPRRAAWLLEQSPYTVWFDDQVANIQQSGSRLQELCGEYQQADEQARARLMPSLQSLALRRTTALATVAVLDGWAALDIIRQLPPIDRAACPADAMGFLDQTIEIEGTLRPSPDITLKPWVNRPLLLTDDGVAYTLLYEGPPPGLDELGARRNIHGIRLGNLILVPERAREEAKAQP